MFGRRFKTFVECLCAGLLVTAVLIQRSHFWRGFDKWHSKAQPYKWQIDAFLEGHLYILKKPFGLWHDAIWGRGVQQIWGLGVPLLQMPFEIAARIAGFQAGFPNRLLFLVFVIATASVLWRSLRDLATPRWLMIPPFAVAFLSPAFVMMAASDFLPYETAILYGCMLTFCILASALSCLRRPAGGKLACTAFAAGFLCLIKITFLVHGFVCLATLLWLNRKAVSKKWMAASGALFAVGPFLLLSANQIRFGSPFEFGYALNLSFLSSNDLALRFGYPFAHEPILSAARELIGSLFLDPKPGGDYYDANLFTWQSATPRFRETVFDAFNMLDGIVFVVCWIGVFGRRLNREKNPIPKPALFLSIYGAVTFFLLFFGYLRSPTISSRYWVDFLPSFFASTTGLYLFVLSLPAVKSRRFLSLAAAAVLACIVVLDNGFADQVFVPNENVVSADQYDNHVIEQLQSLASEFRLPDSYVCVKSGENFDEAKYRAQQYGIDHNGSGWNYFSNCWTNVATAVFFEKPACVKIVYSVQIPTADGGTAFAGIVDPFLAMKSNLEFMTKAKESISPDDVTAVYCRSPESVAHSEDDELSRFQMVTIKWVDEKTTLRDLPRVKLFSITKVARP